LPEGKGQKTFKTETRNQNFRELEGKEPKFCGRGKATRPAQKGEKKTSMSKNFN